MITIKSMNNHIVKCIDSDTPSWLFPIQFSTFPRTKRRRMTTASVLIVDDEQDILDTARMFLKQELSTVHIESDPTQLPARMKATDYDVILLDMNFTRGVNDGEEGFYWLSEILRLDPQAVVILITAY